MKQFFKIYDVENIDKNIRVEASSATELLITSKAGNHAVSVSVDRGQLMRQIARMDEMIGAQYPGFGFIKNITWNWRGR